MATAAAAQRKRQAHIPPNLSPFLLSRGVRGTLAGSVSFRCFCSSFEAEDILRVISTVQSERQE